MTLFEKNTETLKPLVDKLMRDKEYKEFQRLSTVFALYRTKVSFTSADYSAKYVLDNIIDQLFIGKVSDLYYTSVLKFVTEQYPSELRNDVCVNSFYSQVLEYLNDLALSGGTQLEDTAIHN